MSGFGPIAGRQDSNLNDEARVRRATKLELANVLDAIYAYATDPLRWEEMVALLISLDGAVDDDLGDVVEALQLHVGRAESLAQRLHEDRTPPLPGFCHLLLGGDQRILDMSPMAATMLQPFCDPLEAGRRLCFHDAENGARLRLLVAAVEKDDGVAPQLLRIVDADDEEVLFIYVVPHDRLPHSLTRTMFAAGSASDDARAVVLLMPDRAVHENHALLGGLGITPAESRLAARLKEGLSLKDAADDLAIAVSTARNQLKSIFEKLGINRQSDLVRHLTELGQLSAYVHAGTSADEDRSARTKAGDGGVVNAERAFFTLANGRKLAFREYGWSDGIPVVLMQSSLSSSLVWPREVAASIRHGVRLIAFERPGTGLSTPDPHLDFESFANDLREFLDASKIERVHLLARSSSALFALTAAARLGPRAVRVMLCAPRFGPPRRDGRKPSMLGYYFGHLSRYPWLLDATLSILRAKLSRPLIRPLIFQFFDRSPADIDLIRRTPDLLDYMIDSVIETVSHSTAGLERESRLFIEGKAGDFSGLVAPVVVWHGEADGIVPVADLNEGLRVASFTPEELRIFPGEGHNFAVVRYDEIMRRLLS